MASSWTGAGGRHRLGGLVDEDRIPPDGPEIGHKPMQALLEKTRDFTAIFCFNDIAAIGAIRALRTRASRFPGCLGGRLRRHPVGRLHHAVADHGPPAAFGDGPARRAGAAGPHREQGQRVSGEIVMAPELVVRESTGPARRKG